MTLFPAIDHRKFMAISYKRYASMRLRVHAKKLGPMPFGVLHFRNFILTFTENQYSAAIKCRYCGIYVDIWEAEFDHAVPLSRGGSTDLFNIEIICEKCNSEKGSMLPEEFIDFRITVFHRWPLAATDIFRRLRIANKLAAGQGYQAKKLRKQNGTSDERNALLKT